MFFAWLNSESVDKFSFAEILWSESKLFRNRCASLMIARYFLVGL